MSWQWGILQQCHQSFINQRKGETSSGYFFLAESGCFLGNLMNLTAEISLFVSLIFEMGWTNFKFFKILYLDIP